jgi:iron(III) transport system permease protein
MVHSTFSAKSVSSETFLGQFIDRFRRRHQAPPAIVLLAAFAGAGSLVPLVYLAVRAFEADLETVARLILRQRTLDLLVNTLAMTGGVLAFTTLIALPLAILATRFDLRARKLITLMCIMPLAVPGYVMAFALIGLSGNQGFAAQFFGFQIPRIQGYWGAVLALTLYTYPYMFLNLRAALYQIDPAQEHVARCLGCGPMEAFAKVVLPQLLPALLAGWLVIGLYTLGDFGAVALMRYEVFSYTIFTQYSGAFDRVYAAWLSLILLSLTMSLVMLDALVLRGRRFGRASKGVARGHPLLPLGRLAPFAYGFIALVILAGIGLPVMVLVHWMLRAEFTGFIEGVLPAFGRSVLAALPAAVLAAALAFPVAYLRVRYPTRLAQGIERLAYVSYAAPPLTFALAYVFLSLNLFPALYQTLTMLVIAYAFSFLALAIGPQRAALMHCPPNLEYAARVLGSGRFGALSRITLPMSWRGILAGATLVFVLVIKELPITFLLAPTGFSTLATSVFAHTSEGFLADAAPYALAIVVFSSLFIGLSLRVEGQSDERKAKYAK